MKNKRIYIYEGNNQWIVSRKLASGGKLLYVASDVNGFNSFINSQKLHYSDEFIKHITESVLDMLNDLKSDVEASCVFINPEPLTKYLDMDDEDDDEDCENESDEAEAYDDENRWLNGEDDAEDSQVQLTCSDVRCIAEALDYFISYHDVSDSEKETIENLLYNVL